MRGPKPPHSSAKHRIGNGLGMPGGRQDTTRTPPPRLSRQRAGGHPIWGHLTFLNTLLPDSLLPGRCQDGGRDSLGMDYSLSPRREATFPMDECIVLQPPPSAEERGL